ncbi:immunoglobulin-like domain-containing protein [uncultured Aquimarina sp.]|uniref:immunoglobulin-like domain-containing protein n=1 Tax=uncultured Aquimarina sp. TaxID=575652 RepID=UPI002605D1C6|nr:immunoglobulin-like domain-containing protein [uncultured Aquimarina sp.]
MKKNYLLTLLLFCTGIAISNAQYTSISDTNFEAALEALGYDDISGDGQVPTANIASITDLDVRNKQITDLSGIEDFIALKELMVNQNLISSVDLSQNTALELLFIGDNDLTTLDLTANTNLDHLSIDDLSLAAGIDISTNTKLTRFSAENCNISTIDLSNNTAIEDLDLSNNALTSLDVTNVTALETLTIEDNQLTIIDLSNNTLLKTFAFSRNDFLSLNFLGLSNLKFINGSANENLATINLGGVTALETFQVNNGILTSLDVSEAVNLSFLSVAGHQLETLNLSNNIALNTIQIFSNNLTSLDLRNIDVTQITFFGASSNDNLECISVSDVALAEENLSSDFRYSIDCAVYTYIPDDNFEAALAAYDDIPGDNNVPTAAIEVLTSLDISNQNIVDISGIEDFIALTSLNASANGLEKVDFSDNTSLQTINLEENSLRILDVSSLVNLTGLEVDKNALFDLNIQNGANTNLTFFDATENTDLSCILVDNATYATANFTNIDNQTSFSETDCTVYVSIPDANFEAALSAYDDTSNDGQIPLVNIYFVTTLNVTGEGITDLTGIEAFASLKDLNCGSNALTSIDVSNNTKLEVLNVESNQLTVLDLSKNTLLKDLDCDDNGFTALDFSSNVNLVVLSADDNSQLTTIDITGCTLLEEMIVDDCNISTLDLSTNINLKELDLDTNNNLSSLDVSNNILLEEIDLNNCLFTTIDFSANTQLKDVDLSENQITNIDVSANTLLENVDLDGNQFTEIDFTANINLETVDIDENPLLTKVTFGNSPNLRAIYADETALETIDVSSFGDLEILDLGQTNLTTLDISANTNLRDLRVDNAALVSLDLRNGNNNGFYRMDATTNAGLSCIMVDDATAAVTDFTDIDAGVIFSETTCGYTLIPDANFEVSLSAYDDIANDGQVPTANIESVSILDISNSNIADLTGIEAFGGLENLNADSNSLSTIDLSSNTNLQILSAMENGLTTVNVSGNPELERINLNDNNISNIDVTNNIFLEILEINENNLTAIDLSTNTNLEELDAYDNQISSIDLSNNTFLEVANLEANDMNSINISGLADLDALFLEENNLSSIDLSDNISLTTLILNDNIALSTINLTNNVDIQVVSCNNCNGLSSINLGTSTDLESVSLNNTALTSIDVSALVDLIELSVRETDITFLDLSNNSILVDIYANDCKLRGINLRSGGNTSIDELVITGNPDLYCVQVDDATYSAANWTNIDAQTSFNDVSCDYTPPVIMLIGDNPQTIELGAGYIELGATVDDGITNIVIYSSDFVDAVGSYTIKYNATDASGNVATQVTRTIHVVDTTAPVITLTGDNPQTIELGAGYTELGATVDDGITNVIIDSSDFVDAVGNYTIRYNASDASGNVATEVTRTIHVVDTTAPVISLVGDNPQTIELGAGYTELGANVDDGITNIVVDSSDFIDAVGNYAIRYNATDASGNVATEVTRAVDVVDTTNPTLVCQNIIVQLDDTGNVTITADQVDNGTTDLSGIVSLSLDISTFDCATIGDHTVVLTAIDANGNENSCTATVTVEDSIAPVFNTTTLPSDIEVTFDTGDMYTLTDFTVGVEVIDNCDTNRSVLTSTITQNPVAGTLLGAGDHIITLIATDANSNEESVTFTITVSNVLSVEENEQDRFTLYPNPAKQQFQVSGISGEAELSIYDVNGRSLLIEKVDAGQSISIQELPNGVYFVKITIGNTYKTIRLMKNE